MHSLFLMLRVFVSLRMRHARSPMSWSSCLTVLLCCSAALLRCLRRRRLGAAAIRCCVEGGARVGLARNTRAPTVPASTPLDERYCSDKIVASTSTGFSSHAAAATCMLAVFSTTQPACSLLLCCAATMPPELPDVEEK